MTSNELLRLYLKNNWKIHRITKKGHRIMIKGNKTAVIPFHAKKELAKGTQESLLKLLKEN